VLTADDTWEAVMVRAHGKDIWPSELLLCAQGNIASLQVDARLCYYDALSSYWSVVRHGSHAKGLTSWTVLSELDTAGP
jgi:hypothetical protein